MSFDSFWNTNKNSMMKLHFESDAEHSRRVAHEAWHEGRHELLQMFNTPDRPVNKIPAIASKDESTAVRGK